MSSSLFHLTRHLLSRSSTASSSGGPATSLDSPDLSFHGGGGGVPPSSSTSSANSNFPRSVSSVSASFTVAPPLSVKPILINGSSLQRAIISETSASSSSSSINQSMGPSPGEGLVVADPHHVHLCSNHHPHSNHQLLSKSNHVMINCEPQQKQQQQSKSQRAAIKSAANGNQSPKTVLAGAGANNHDNNPADTTTTKCKSMPIIKRCSALSTNPKSNVNPSSSSQNQSKTMKFLHLGYGFHI